jgi:hypothetical protein
MSLIPIINKYCPKVSHEHSNVLHLISQDNYPDGCLLCKVNRERLDFNHNCYNYYTQQVINLNKLQFDTLEDIFTRNGVYFLPLEIREIIYNYSSYLKKEIIDIKLDDLGIHHMMGCDKCSKTFTIFINCVSCPNHVIPRIKNY